MNNDVKVIKLLLEKESLTINGIAKALSMNYRIAYEQTMKLEKEGFVRVERVGNAKLCRMASKFDPRVFDAETERRKELFKNKDFQVLHKRLSELQFPFIALIFGSHAKKTADRHSDIDLMVIGGEEKKVNSELSLWPKGIHLTWVSYSDFIHMAKSREFSVVNEAIKNHVILLGIEEYHRLMDNVG